MGPKLTQAEGFILGVGAKMFTIAGPVIVYGVSASVVYGFVYWISTLFYRAITDRPYEHRQGDRFNAYFDGLFSIYSQISL